jgi:hypothetical protein
MRTFSQKSAANSNVGPTTRRTRDPLKPKGVVFHRIPQKICQAEQRISAVVPALSSWLACACLIYAFPLKAADAPK